MPFCLQTCQVLACPDFNSHLEQCHFKSDIISKSLYEVVPSAIDPEVLVVAHIHQSVITAPFVRIDNRRWIHFSSNNGQKRRFLAIGNDFSIHSSVSLEN